MGLRRLLRRARAGCTVELARHARFVDRSIAHDGEHVERADANIVRSIAATSTAIRTFSSSLRGQEALDAKAGLERAERALSDYYACEAPP